MNRINQPDRISVDSFMDTTTATNGQYYTFVNHAPNTALVGAKEITLLRCSIPYIQLNIPTWQTVFYYYKTASATAVPTANDLHAIRLYPSDYIAPSGFTAYTRNAFFPSPSQFVEALNTAASAGGDNVTYNTLWIANDVLFIFDETSNRITFQGLDAGSYYCIAGYNDPLVRASQATAAIVTYNFDTTTTIQPYVLGYTLNLRCGFACDGVNIPKQSGTNFLSVKCANLTGTSFAAGEVIPADTFPDLNYTGSIYIYSNIVGNSGFGSVNKKNLLGVIPVDVPLGGVIQYTGHSAPAYARKVASEIYSVDVELRDDANQPFFLPDSANVNMELSILYD